MRCNKCGYENPNDSNFCINCGSKLEKNNYKICPNCGAKNYSDAVFCSECGKMFETAQNTEENQIVIQKEQMNSFGRICLILSIIASSFTIIAFNVTLAVIGLTVSVATLVLLAIGLLTKKIKGSIKVSISLGIYSLIGNFIWIAFLIWMLPNF